MLEPEEFVTRWEHSSLPEEFDSGQPNWDRSPLVRFTPSSEASFLPESSRRFLIEAGLPTRVYMLHFGTPDTTLPSLPSVIPPGEELRSGYKLPSGYEGYHVLAIAMEKKDGINYGMGFLCFHSGQGGRLFHISTLENNRVRFVNSSVEQYAEYLLVMRDYGEWEWLFIEAWNMRLKAENNNAGRDWDWEELQFHRDADYETWDQFMIERRAHINETVERLRQVDPLALEDYWSEPILLLEIL